MRTTLSPATKANAASAAWIGVKRHLGAPGPPAASATTQVSTITGSTRRSRLRSIGSEALSNTPLNGTSQSMAMKPAIIHGSSAGCVRPIVASRSVAVGGCRGATARCADG